jgi:hypothetical protein
MFRCLPMKHALLLAVFLYFLAPCPAHAYFDLGTGTYMLQLLFAFGAAVWISFRNSWPVKMLRKDNTASATKENEPPPKDEKAPES